MPSFGRLRERRLRCHFTLRRRHDGHSAVGHTRGAYSEVLATTDPTADRRFE
jgi:hypothetical protein